MLACPLEGVNCVDQQSSVEWVSGSLPDTRSIRSKGERLMKSHGVRGNGVPALPWLVHVPDGRPLCAHQR